MERFFPDSRPWSLARASWSDRKAGQSQANAFRRAPLPSILLGPVLAAVCLGAALAPAAAHQGSPPPDAAGWFVYPCLHVASPPVIDGDLSDVAWQKSVPVSGFRYSASQLMAPYQTVMRLLWDHDWLYMVVDVEEPAMDKVVVTARGRDAYVFNDDSIEWFVHPWHSGDAYYQFGLNLAVGMWDSLRFEKAWDCEWRAAVKRGSDRWYAEAAMPLGPWGKRLLRPGDLWGFNLCRERQAGGSRELMNWANVLADFHRPDLFGHLLFLDDLAQLTAAQVAAVARELGCPTRVFTPQGWWQVDRQAEQVTYQKDLRHAIDVRLRSELKEIRASINREGQPELWDRYRALADRWHGIRQLGEQPVGPVDWAHARQALEGLETQVPELLWEVRLTNLLQRL